jgi:hypothetical protein
MFLTLGANVLACNCADRPTNETNYFIVPTKYNQYNVYLLIKTVDCSFHCTEAISENMLSMVNVYPIYVCVRYTVGRQRYRKRQVASCLANGWFVLQQRRNQDLGFFKGTQE